MTTFPHRIAQAIRDPGSITPRKLDDDGRPAEHLTRWQTRAVLDVVSEYRWDLAEEVEGRLNPVTVATLLGLYGVVLLAAGLWLGSVWL